ncbi:MAG: hypothetical protein LBJ95_01750 [Oscillospiraceae bacterium]|nr:hypothetical protein [Oscillospiraceae bacterium]
MKKLLSLIMVSTMYASVCAKTVSADFKYRLYQGENGLSIYVWWDGTEDQKDLITLCRSLRKSPVLSFFDGYNRLVARNVKCGDPINTLSIPAAATLKVKQTFVSGRPGEIQLTTTDATWFPECNGDDSPDLTALDLFGKLGFPKKLVRKHDPGYSRWVADSQMT